MTEKIIETEIAVVGAGGCGLTAALVAAEKGKRVLLLEQDDKTGGSTAMSAGIFVAAGSKLQQANGEFGTVDELAEDIFRLNGRQSDKAVTKALCAISGSLMDWLVAIGIQLEHMSIYRYPGMTKSWIHSPPQRDGSVITDALLKAVNRMKNIDLRLKIAVTGLTSVDSTITGLQALTSAGESFVVYAKAVILATSGFGNNRTMVSRFIPEFAEAAYYGAPYAKGDSIKWGQGLGAALDHIGAYQSHSSIAFPKMMLVTTYLINHGAIQINQEGQRFGNEIDSYAQHALAVQAQPGKVVYELFDEHILEQTLVNYPRFQECIEAGIVKRGEILPELAQEFNLDPGILVETVMNYNSAIARGVDEFGRKKFGKPLSPPYYGIRVTSALVQTLGGLRVNAQARVMREDGTPIIGLFAGGGAASGLAGELPEGYLAGTGLLSAFGLGWIAGHQAAESFSGSID